MAIDTPEIPPPTSDVPPLPVRPETMHKGQAGRVAIVAGSRGMSGAAALAGLGALRGGAGLVRVFCPAGVQPIVAGCEPSLMTFPLVERDDGAVSAACIRALMPAIAWADVCAVGPGLTANDDTRAVVETLLAEFAGPIVLDADGLNAVAGRERWWAARRGRALVLTPHPGEMQRLRAGTRLAALEVESEDDSARLRAAWELAALTDAVVVLKGHRTIVATVDRTFVNRTGNPGMACGGMGDVLTGLIAALVGQGLARFDAACVGVHSHGAAADALSRQVGPQGFLAREVADALPATFSGLQTRPFGYR